MSHQLIHPTLNYNDRGVRKGTLHGREYIVVPMTLIVPGVLDGSNGPLYYPPEELSEYPEVWNGVHMVAYHPSAINENGEEAPVSARDPQVLNENGLGLVFGAHYDDALRAEGWFDVELVKRYDERLPDSSKIMPRLIARQPIELSTGLFTDNEESAGVCPRTGKRYTLVARNYRPDHLAILPEQKGACGVADGCMVGNSTTPDLPGDEMTRAQMIKWLTANCTCYKGADAAKLQKLDDTKLKSVYRGGVANKLTKLLGNSLISSLQTLVSNADGDPESMPDVDIAGLAKFLGVTIDPKSDPVGFINELKAQIDLISGKLGGPAAAPVPAPEAEEPVAMMDPVMDPEKDDEQVVMSDPEEPKPVPTGNRGRLTREEWIQMMPEDFKDTWTDLVSNSKRERVALLEQITAGTSGAEKQSLMDSFKGMKLPQLRVVANRLKAVKPAGSRGSLPEDDLPIFSGGGFTGNHGPSDLTANQYGETDEPLPLPGYVTE